MHDKFYTPSQSEWLIKPVHDMQILMDALTPASKVLECKKNIKLNFTRSGKLACYLVFEGRGLVCRSRDNLVIATTRAPIIVGLTNVLFPLREEYYWRPQTDCLVMVIDAQVAYKIIADKNLWQSLAMVMGFLAYRLGEYSIKSTARTSLSQITMQIHALMQEPVELRMKTSLTRYILDRTLLSRSYVMKIVAELKAANKIVLDGTYLVHAKGLIDEE